MLESSEKKVLVRLGTASRTMVSKMKSSLVLGRKRTDVSVATSAHARIERGIESDGFPAPKALGTTRHWMLLAGTTLGLLLLDAIWLQHISRSLRGHVVALSVWVIIATLYSTTLYGLHGVDAVFMWWEGYLLDWLLSFNNLFAFHLVFKSCRTPSALRLTALSQWIVGAIFCRLALFKLISEIMSVVAWFRFVGGAFLVYSAIAVVRDDDDANFGNYGTSEDIPGVTLLKSIAGSRVSCAYGEGGSWFVWGSERTRIGLLPLVVIMLLMVDTLCALDSVSAKVAQIPSEYIACSSSVLAMFGMRSLFFIIEDMVQEFELLKYGIAIILVFIGIQLVVTGWIEISALVSLEVIGSVFMGSVVISVLRGKHVSSARGSKMTHMHQGEEPGVSQKMVE